MKKNRLQFRNTRLVRTLKRLFGEELGAVAMEYILIALLVGAAVVGLVMAFSGTLRNMLGSATNTLNATNVDGVEEVAKDYESKRGKMEKETTKAIDAGNKIGGDFSSNSTTSSGSGSGK